MSGDPWCDGAVACLVLVLGGLLVVGSGGAAFGLALLLGAVIGVLLGLIALKLWGDGGAGTGGGWRWSAEPRLDRSHGLPSAQGSKLLFADEMLRQRYARSELSRERYLTILEDILKERYVRGELELDEYEARLDQLLREPGARVTRS